MKTVSVLRPLLPVSIFSPHKKRNFIFFNFITNLPERQGGESVRFRLSFPAGARRRKNSLPFGAFCAVMEKTAAFAGEKGRKKHMARIDLLPSGGCQYKANLHCHSHLSDGEFSPEKLRDIYREKGSPASGGGGVRNPPG